jgi:hypothetical protein
VLDAIDWLRRTGDDSRRILMMKVGRSRSEGERLFVLRIPLRLRILFHRICITVIEDGPDTRETFRLLARLAGIAGSLPLFDKAL